MRSRRNWVVVGMVMAVGAVLAVADVASAGQDPETGRYWSVPRTADGQPDLQGIWANNSATPLQRPEQFGDKAVLTDEELAELTQLIQEFRDNEQAGDLLGDRLIQQALGNATFNDFDEETGNYNAFWLVDRELDNRTSLVIEPSNGRIPPLTAAAQERAEARRAYAREHPSDAASNRGHGDRCLHFEAPRISAGYNSYLQILQTPDYVGVTQEMGHISRMIPVDGRAPLATDIRLWTGDSRGYWDGDTLVVETRNYSQISRFQGATDSLRVTERYTRLDADTLEHVVTMHDPNTWTEPWTVKLLLERTEDAIFEYACHEGNYAMPGILGGARAEERAAAENEQGQ